MHTIATHLFQFSSPAAPEQVWGALTRAELTARYFFGMTVESSWTPGAAVVVYPPEGSPGYATLAGEVLAAEEARRLSYTLGAGAGHPTTFVTWEIAAAGDPAHGSHLTLYVDEAQSRSDGELEAVRSWGLVITALQGLLATLALGK